MGRLLATTGPIAALTCACVAITLANSCRADAINSWQGASASVNVGGNQATNAGATASAYTAGSFPPLFDSLHPQVPIFVIPTTSGGSASASGNPDNLLTATSTYLNTGSPGLVYPNSSPIYPIQATASWNNDSLIVHAPPGASLPDSVQLQFKVDLLPGITMAGLENGNLSIGINGKNTNLTPVGAQGQFLGNAGDLGGVKLQPADNYQQTGTFNIALALHPNGVSDPFSLSVSSIGYPAAASAISSMDYTSFISLSLTGVTLPDGTSLTAAGYSATFASGMQPVPEPATFVVWGLLAAAAVTVRHRAVSSRAGR